MVVRYVLLVLIANVLMIHGYKDVLIASFLQFLTRCCILLSICIVCILSKSETYVMDCIGCFFGLQKFRY